MIDFISSLHFLVQILLLLSLVFIIIFFILLLFTSVLKKESKSSTSFSWKTSFYKKAVFSILIGLSGFVDFYYGMIPLIFLSVPLGLYLAAQSFKEERTYFAWIGVLLNGTFLSIIIFIQILVIFYMIDDFSRTTENILNILFIVLHYYVYQRIFKSIYNTTVK